MSDQIVSLLTLAVAGFVLFLRVKDYRKHRALTLETTEKDVATDNIKLKGIKTGLYLFGAATVTFIVLAFISQDLIQGTIYVGVFAIMTLSEWINVKTVDHISVFEKNVIYSGIIVRLKNIRTITISNKRMATIAMLDGKSHIVPKTVGNALLELQKNRKSK